MKKVLIICGPTATGKTKLGIDIAKKFGGEIVSADSRQVYVGRNIITGKDLPANLKPQISKLKWRDRYLKYYEVDGVRIWLYDIVSSGKEFNVSYWKECADLVISDILSRNRLPIVVGGTGLFIKSLTQSLSQIHVPPHSLLRIELANKSAEYLFDYLNKLDSIRAAILNISDRHNPRRLIRAIEISLSKTTINYEPTNYELFLIGLTAPRAELYSRIDQRVMDRVMAGAAAEDPILAADPPRWQFQEHQIARQQLTWFAKQPRIHWFDITSPSWQIEAEKIAIGWYNQ